MTLRRRNGAVGLLLLGALAGCEESSPPSEAAEAERDAEETGVASAALVSPSFALGSYPLEPYPFPTGDDNWDVEWECGVGHLVWIEKLADRDRVMQVRFNQAGQLLDTAPLLVYEQDPPLPPDQGGNYDEGPRRVDSVRLERSAEGVWLVAHEVENWIQFFAGSGKTNRVRGFVLSADGSVSGNTVLGQATDYITSLSDDLYSIDIYAMGFDGTHSYAVLQITLHEEPSAFHADLNVVRDDGLVVRSASGSEVSQQPFLFNSFACGFGHCMFRWFDAPPSPENKFHSDIFSNNGLLQATYPAYTDSAKPIGQPLALESCDFLVAGAKSWVLEGHSIVGGPHVLPGTAGGSFVDDGVELTRYFTDTGVFSSHSFADDGAPEAVTVSEPSLVGNRIVRIGDGKSLAVLRTGNTFTAQFVGSNALVEVDGQCDPLGDAGLASGNNPDCSQFGGSGGNGGTPCIANWQCASGFCVDGMCCNSGCAGDCEACSVATGASIDGVCSLRASGSTCRAGAVCNPAEQCDGVSSECPADVFDLDGTSCFGVCPSSCLAGQCVAPPDCDFEILCGAGQCDDGDACTLDKCFSASGCTHTPLTGNCDLDNPCAENGICTANGCVGTAKPEGTPCPGGSCVGLVCTPEGGSGGAGGSGGGGAGSTGGAGGSSENGGSAEGGAGSGGAGPTGGAGGENAGTSTASGEPPQRLELSGGTGSCDVASGRTPASGLWLAAALAGAALRRRKRKLAS